MIRTAACIVGFRRRHLRDWHRALRGMRPVHIESQADQAVTERASFFHRWTLQQCLALRPSALHGGPFVYMS